MNILWPQTAVVALLLSLYLPREAESRALPEGWERTVVFVEVERSAGIPCPPADMFKVPDDEKAAPAYCARGTGFIMNICGNTLLFTNRHVLASSRPLFVRMSDKAGKFVRLQIGEWRGHSDLAVDIAAAFINLPKGAKTEDFNVTVFNEDRDRRAEKPQSFLAKLEDLRVGDDVLLVGYPSEIPDVLQILQTYDQPIFRGGVVSAKFPGLTRLKVRQETGAIVETQLKDMFFIDAWSFGGNSGSPVFLQPVVGRYQGDRPHLPLGRSHIIGVQGATIPRTGLTIVYAADGIEQTAAQFPGAKCPATIPKEIGK